MGCNCWLPSYHKKAKKLSKRALDVPRNPYEVSRASMVVRCGKCNQIGHNTRSWKAPVMGETPWQQRMRQKKAQEMATKVVQNEGKLGLAVHTRSKKKAKKEDQLSEGGKLILVL
uniref:Uncharacterized protein n=1 Tax=Fagus sylvatica TaxID=28930 RepID=A0A2N9E3D7_FAGSY